jgi:hypothetical protein
MLINFLAFIFVSICLFKLIIVACNRIGTEGILKKASIIMGSLISSVLLPFIAAIPAFLVSYAGIIEIDPTKFLLGTLGMSLWLGILLPIFLLSRFGVAFREKRSGNAINNVENGSS